MAFASRSCDNRGTQRIGPAKELDSRVLLNSDAAFEMMAPFSNGGI